MNITATPTRRRAASLAVAMTAALAVAAGCGTTAEAEAANDTDPALVETDNGTVRGVVADDTRSFQAIPYAAPPTDELRWQPPQPADNWKGELDATAPSDACVQPVDQPIAIPDGVEDCLYLNVTTPTEIDEELPVIVWIHGGSMVYGDGASYGAQKLAAQGEAVVVTINYRLGAFGFMAHPDLDDTANLGLQDQQAALRWVRDNANAFGGDTDNVTLMGQSGGGYSVCGHMASPDSTGLFDKAMIHSAGCVGSPDGEMSLEDAEANGVAMAEAADCTYVDGAEECLRGKTAEEILAAAETGHAGYRVVIDENVLPQSMSEAFAAGEFNRVPVLYGSAHDEESGRIGSMEAITGGPMDADGYRRTLEENYGDNAEAVLAQYPLSEYDSPGEAATAALTDGNWSTPTYATQQALAQYVPVYAFDVTQPESPYFEGFDRPSFPLGTGHMIDLAYLFEYPMFEALDTEQAELSDTMIDYWSQFARQGDPNHTGAAQWKPFETGQPYTQALETGDGLGEIDYAAEHHSEFWNSLSG